MVDSVDLNDAETPRQPDEEIIKGLAALKPIEYDRRRKESAKVLSISTKTLDAEVKALKTAKEETDDLPFTEIEPHPEPIIPAALLDEISTTLRRFIVMDGVQADAAALWLAMTWYVDVIELAPLLIINAPEKSCGKTQLLTLLARMAYRPLSTDNASASALFRAVEEWKPTLFIDEADTFFRDNAELHGMVNAGYSRNGYVLRSEAHGDSFKVKRFSVYSAKAISGIALEKHLPDATMSRGIVLNLRRKLQHEMVERLRHAGQGLFSGIAAKLARFSDDCSGQVRGARPVLPESLTDREQDNFEPLLAIAASAGDEWLNRATAAALALSGNDEKTRSINNELLADIKQVFESKSPSTEFISTVELIESLCADEEAQWATYNKGRAIAGRQISKLLSPYGIESKQKKFLQMPKRGYELEQFNDIFTRYLVGAEKNISTTPEIIRYPLPNRANPDTTRLSAVTDKKTVTLPSNLSVTTPEIAHKKVTDNASGNVTEKLSVTNQHIDNNVVIGKGNGYSDKSGEPRKTFSQTKDVGRI